MASMEISHRIDNQVLIITLHGESLDEKEVPLFKKTVQDLILDQNSHQLILDLHQLQFIDSSGLGSFLCILRSLNTQGGNLKLAGMTKPIRTLFEMVCMHKIFEIFNSTDDALHSF